MDRRLRPRLRSQSPPHGAHRSLPIGIGRCGSVLSLQDGRGERGSVLVLMPVGVLIVLLLGAIAVDLTAVHLRRQQAVDAAASAANDAVTFGLDEGALRTGHGYHLDPVRVREVVLRSI